MFETDSVHKSPLFLLDRTETVSTLYIGVEDISDEYSECWQRTVEEREAACGNADLKTDGYITQRDKGRTVLEIEQC